MKSHTRINVIKDTNYSVKQPVELIEEMIAKYSTGLKTIVKSAPTASEIVVLLTGSTGHLGSHILISLVSDRRIAKVYTLNRSSPTSLMSRQKAAMTGFGLDVELLEREDGRRLVQLVGNLSRNDLGLEPDMYNEVKGSVTHIIHNAWTVNFAMPLSSFEPQVANTRHLVDISSQFIHHVKFFFVSSITAAYSWNTTNPGAPVPEQALDNPETSMFGYGNAKFVIEHVLSNASRIGAVSATSLRVGQICGATTTGAWTPTDWVPTLLKSSIAMGCFPALDDVVAWIPMDVTAEVIVDFVIASRNKSLPDVLNVTHPRPVQWSDLFNAFLDERFGSIATSVPYDQWLRKLENRAKNATKEDLIGVPALRILHLFRSIAVQIRAASKLPKDLRESVGLPIMGMGKAQEFSSTLRDVRPLGEEQTRLWFNYWGSRGLAKL